MSFQEHMGIVHKQCVEAMGPSAMRKMTVKLRGALRKSKIWEGKWISEFTTRYELLGPTQEVITKIVCKWNSRSAKWSV